MAHENGEVSLLAESEEYPRDIFGEGLLRLKEEMNSFYASKQPQIPPNQRNTVFISHEKSTHNIDQLESGEEEIEKNCNEMTIIPTNTQQEVEQEEEVESTSSSDSSSDVYTFEQDRINTVNEMKTIRVENRLAEFYDKQRLDQYESMVLKYMDNNHKKGIDICLDRTLLNQLYTISFPTLQKAFTTLFDTNTEIFEKKKKPEHYFMCCIYKKSITNATKKKYHMKMLNKKECENLKKAKTQNVWLWVVKQESDTTKDEGEEEEENIIACYVMPLDRCSDFMEIKHNIDAFKASVLKIDTEMSSFIKEEELEKNGFERNVFLDRKKRTLLKLAEIYRSRNFLVYFQPTDYYEMFQHLLTSKKQTPEELLDASLQHQSVKKLVKERSDRKKCKIVLGMKRYQSRDPFLVDQLEYNYPIFVNNGGPLATIMNTDPRGPQKTVYIGSTCYDGAIISLHYVPSSGYEEIERRKVLQRKLNPKRLSENDVFLRKSMERMKEDAEVESTRNCNGQYIKEQLLKKLPAHITLSPSVDEFDCSERFFSLWNERGGTQVSEAVLKNFITHTIDKTSKNAETRGWNTFEGDLSLNKTSFSRYEFDEKKRSRWPQEIQDIMNDPADASRVQDYERQNLTHIDTVNVNIGSETLATSVVPCSVPPQYYQVFNTINIGNVDNRQITNICYDSNKTKRLLDNAKGIVSEIVREKNEDKRKELEETFLACLSKKKRSKAKKRKEIEAFGDESTNKGSKITITSREVDQLNEDLTQICVRCKKMLTHKHFYVQGEEKKKGETDVKLGGRIRNMCHSCIGKQNRECRKQRSTDVKIQ